MKTLDVVKTIFADNLVRERSVRVVRGKLGEFWNSPCPGAPSNWGLPTGPDKVSILRLHLVPMWRYSRLQWLARVIVPTSTAIPNLSSGQLSAMNSMIDYRMVTVKLILVAGGNNRGSLFELTWVLSSINPGTDSRHDRLCRRAVGGDTENKSSRALTDSVAAQLNIIKRTRSIKTSNIRSVQMPASYLS